EEPDSGYSFVENRFDNPVTLDEQLISMKRLIVGISCVVAFCSAVAQDVITAKSPADTTTAQSHTLNPIETALKKYVTAYDSRNVPELLTVWPDLQNHKKEFDKIRDHLT